MAVSTLPRTAGGASGAITPPIAATAAHGPTILALDLGTTTGWAIRLGEDDITSGTLALRPSRFEGGGMRFLRFRAWLEEMQHASGSIGRVAFEEVRRHGGTDASHVYGGLLATLTAWGEERGVPHEGVPVGTIKRFVTGRGNADKAAMVAAVTTRGFAPTDDNEADAIALLLWIIDGQGGRT